MRGGRGPAVRPCIARRASAPLKTLMSSSGSQERGPSADGRTPTEGGVSLSLADLLEFDRDALVEDWLARITLLPGASRLTREQLVDALPAFIDELHDVVEKDSGDDFRPSYHNEASEAHGRQRLRLGCDVTLVAREYGLLRDCILERAEQQDLHVPLSQVRALCTRIDTAQRGAVSQFELDSSERSRKEAEDRERFFQLSPDMFC
ncbi:MAG: hypothetical protein EOO72_15635, partial [Myxococcaceae bacterium]